MLCKRADRFAAAPTVAPVGRDEALCTALNKEQDVRVDRVHSIHDVQVQGPHDVPAPATGVGLVEDVHNEALACLWGS